ncbi:MAG: TatD family hydrolase [Bryobacteraceae bacterium]
MRLVDTHCHLDDRSFDEDREAVLARARAAGVEKMMAIGMEPAIALAEAHDEIWASVGVHPHEAAKASDETFDRLRALLAHSKAVALGETGLDYHYDFAPRDVQRRVFERQLEMARAASKPVVIHTREAWADTLSILREHRPASGIFHCFSGGPDEAREALEIGFHLSFGGVLTFRNAEALREAARVVPPGRLLVETDAPYLAPVPHRGKRNEPAFVAETVRRLAQVRGEAAEEVAEQAATNFERLCLR